MTIWLITIQRLIHDYLHPCTRLFCLCCSFLFSSNQSTYLDDFSFVSKFMQPCVKSSEFVDIVLIFSPHFCTIFFCCRCYHHLRKKVVCLCILDLSKLVISKEVVGYVLWWWYVLLLLYCLCCRWSKIYKQRDKNVLGVSFWPPNTSVISPISNININSTATSHHTPPPFQMERNHHQRPKRMREEEKYGTKEKFLCRNAIARPPIQKLISRLDLTHTRTHI